MRQKSVNHKPSSERIVKDIRRATCKQYSAEEKIRIVPDGLRGEHSIAELCRREGIAESLYYNWSKEFLEAGKRRLAGDTARAATSGEAERFIQTSLREWAYARAYNTSEERAAELPRWLHRYNWHRPHSSSGSMPPISKIALTRNNLLRLHS